MPNQSNASSTANTAEIKFTGHEKFTLIVLCIINIFNYVDRYAIAGVLIEIQSHYDIEDQLAGLLQSVFYLAYAICSPAFGFLGDRYSRRLLLIISVLWWTLAAFAGSFAPNYLTLLLLRGMVGVGEAGFTAVAPTLISDLSTKGRRSTQLALFYFAIPIGAGIGYMVSSKAAQLTGKWRWGLRFPSIITACGSIMLWFIINPVRGEKEAEELGGEPVETTPYKEDLQHLANNRTFILTTGAFTCVCFINGALAFWTPKLLYYGFKYIGRDSENVNLGNISLKFGSIILATGLLGVAFGAFLSKMLRPQYSTVDAIISGCGLLISLPLLVSAILTCSIDEITTFVLIFFGQVATNLNWSLVADMLLYVVIPTRRATAVAVQLFFTHIFGDCISPYIVGLLSEHFQGLYEPDDNWLTLKHKGNPSIDSIKTLYALQSSIFTIMIVQAMGSFLFFTTIFYIVSDRKKAEVMTIKS